MAANPFIPQNLVGRQAELHQICQILATDGDLMLAGVPGSGRRSLLRYAAKVVGSRIVEIDCLRATDNHRFLQLLAENILAAFRAPAEQALIEQWSVGQLLTLHRDPDGQARLTWSVSRDDWLIFQALLTLPQVMAELLDCRVVLVFQNFPHIRSWDRSEKWQTYLRDEIQHQSRVSYALIATVAERWVQHTNMQVVFLGPLKNEDLYPWITQTLAAAELEFEPQHALPLFLKYVQGHMGDAIALARRIWLDRQATLVEPTEPVQSHQVHQSALFLVEDLSFTFESLILLLPPSQVRVLESLALDPTTSPHSREYIQKHQLSRGGGLQGALASLEQKGLVYGSEYGYRIALPLLGFWLKHWLA
ncbi:MAG TPA: hypothetical protein V6D18_20995 [Thermosynechococcaceae cyanobacterium]